MSKASVIKTFVEHRDFFKDRDGITFATKWLEMYYASEGFHNTLLMQTSIFTGFGSNPFFTRHKDSLYPLCAHALISFAEGTKLAELSLTRDVGVMAMMQGIEPVIHAIRLDGGDAIGARDAFRTMLNSEEFK